MPIQHSLSVRLFSQLALLSTCLFAAPVALADQVLVAVANNFLGPAKALAKDFESMSGHEVLLSSGSTGKLFAQIVNGAPYDIFMAANAQEPARLEKRGLTVASSRFTYALGRLVLWSADPERVQGDGKALLSANRFRNIAIANPKTAPYGAAAVTVMGALGISLDEMGKRLVLGETVGQAFQFAATGNADLAMIALSQVLDPGNPVPGSYWLVPPEMYDPIQQQAVLLKRSETAPAAKAFLRYLRGPEARRLLISVYGYGVEALALATPERHR